jgi:hypothetical protein
LVVVFNLFSDSFVSSFCSILGECFGRFCWLIWKGLFAVLLPVFLNQFMGSLAAGFVASLGQFCLLSCWQFRGSFLGSVVGNWLTVLCAVMLTVLLTVLDSFVSILGQLTQFLAVWSVLGNCVGSFDGSLGSFETLLHCTSPM